MTTIPTDPSSISQPQLYRINSRIRGPRFSELLNFEIQSIAYDICNTYYKQDVIQAALDSNVTYVQQGNNIPAVWDTNIIYDLNDTVSYLNTVYKSLVTSNQGFTPNTSPGQWSVQSVTATGPVDLPFNTTSISVASRDDLLISITDLARRIHLLESDLTKI